MNKANACDLGAHNEFLDALGKKVGRDKARGRSRQALGLGAGQK